MSYRVLGEFESYDLAEIAAVKVKNRYPGTGRFSIKFLNGEQMQKQKFEEYTVPAMFEPLNGAAGGASEFWNTQGAGQKEPEYLENRAVILSLDASDETAQDISGFLTALGGLNIAVY